MIPKTLIYCNFGNMELRENVELKCMKTWERCFPKSEWNWVELNESTYDVSKNEFTKINYEKKNYNLVADYARLDYIYNNGGIYIDTDEYMIKPLSNEILNSNKFFFGSCFSKKSNYNFSNLISWGIFGSPKYDKTIYKIIKMLEDNLKYNNPCIVMSAIKYLYDDKLSNIDFFNIYEDDNIKMYPFDYFTCILLSKDILDITDRTYGIQLYANSWMEYNEYKYNKLLKRIEKIEEYLHDTKNTDSL